MRITSSMARRWGMASLIALLVVGGSLFLAARQQAPQVEYRDPGQVPAGSPRSAPAVLSAEYEFAVGHCGLRSVADFDQDFWEVDESSLTRKENGRFGINSDRGLMTLIDEDTAVYRSHLGGSATLHRQRGTRPTRYCR